MFVMSFLSSVIILCSFFILHRHHLSHHHHTPCYHCAPLKYRFYLMYSLLSFCIFHCKILSIIILSIRLNVLYLSYFLSLYWHCVKYVFISICLCLLHALSFTILFVHFVHQLVSHILDFSLSKTSPFPAQSDPHVSK